VADQTLDLSGGWSCSCHHADDDGGFLELQWSGESAAGPVRVERQAYLSRRDRFAVLSDAVRTTGDRESRDVPIVYETTLPIADGLTGGVAPDSREARLFGGRKNWQRARLFPLAVPQYPGGSGAGGIRWEGERPTIRLTARGGLAAPVVFDWNPWREERRAEWRSLTVTENRRRLSSAHAAAHRLRIGTKHQLFLYRRMDDSPAPRAALGHHVDRETLIADFSRKGRVTPLLSV
jgi:hypothetical protein